MSTQNRSAADPTRKGTLVVRLCNWVGEVVLALPTLHRLQAEGYNLHLVGKGWAPSLLEAFDWPVTVRQGGLLNACQQLRSLRRKLQHRDDMPVTALLLTKSLSSALETRLAGLPPSGYAYDGRSLLLREAYALPQLRHAAHGYWHLAERLLRSQAQFPTTLGWRPSAQQLTAAHTQLQALGISAGRFIVLCPFSGADDRHNRKLWPGFQALAKRLHADGYPIVICPGPGEEIAARTLIPFAHHLASINLGVYGALLGLAHTVIANDTGPGHLAAAAGARLIGVYGPQSVAFWAPIGRRVQYMHPTTGWASVEQVYAATVQL